MQNDEVIVDRSCLFESESPTGSDEDEGREHFPVQFAEITYRENETKSSEPVPYFNLFGTAVLVKCDEAEAEPTQTIFNKRPKSFYFSERTTLLLEQFDVTAVSGEYIQAEARREIAAIQQRAQPAPDINADWKPPRRRCRPGKSARAKRRSRKALLNKLQRHVKNKPTPRWMYK